MRAATIMDRAHLLALRAASRTGHIRTAARVMKRLFPSSRHIDLTLPTGGRLRIPISDTYWARVLVGWEHEPEVRSAIELALNCQPSSVLIDAGANIGYWGAWFAKALPVVAVEAAPPSYRALCVAAERNGFAALHYAVWKNSGQTVQVSWGHDLDEAASVTHAVGKSATSVPTITIDELYARYGEGRPLIVKLDVEGAELAALEGAMQVADRALWLYEDHSGRVSEYFWQAGFRTVHNSDGHITAFRGLPELRSVRAAAAANPLTRPRGVAAYNFIAVRPDGPFGSFFGERGPST